MRLLDILVFIGIVAAVSGISPTLLSILTSLLAGSLGRGHTSQKTWYNGLSFFAGFVGTISIIGTSFWVLLYALPTQTALYISLAVALITIVAAIVEIKDYFWYGRGISHKPYKKLSSALHARTSKQFGFYSSFTLGVISVAATASNIGLITIATASLLYTSKINPSVDWFLLFGMCLLTGSFFTIVTVISGTKTSAIVQWKEESKSVMRLGSGLALVATAWLTLLIMSHTIVTGL